MYLMTVGELNTTIDWDLANDTGVPAVAARSLRKNDEQINCINSVVREMWDKRF